MKKIFGSLSLFLCVLTIESKSQQHIELDWNKDIVAKKKIPVTMQLSADDGIVINALPASTDKQKLVLKVNDTAVPLSNDETGDSQAFFDKLGTKLNNLLAAGVVEVILINGTSEVGRVTLVKGGTAPTGNIGAVGNGGSPGSATNADYENAVKTKYGLKLQSGVIKYNGKLNQARENNIIHVFLDEDGNFHHSSVPTTAREDNLFVFHLFSEDGTGKKFLFESGGVFDPSFEVFGSEPLTQDIPKPNATTGEKEVIKIREQIFGPIGPFTGSCTVKITQVGTGTVIMNKNISIAKLHHITLNAGLYGTFLRNPENIAIFEKPNGDKTLVADDPNSRGFVTVMLTFYPKPRNILFPSTDWKEKIGFSVGTSVSKQLAENFFGGISFDISRGLGLTAGVHYGRINHVIEYPDFDFGKDKFTGTLENRVRKKWDLGFYTGLNLDFRLLTYIFNAPGK